MHTRSTALPTAWLSVGGPEVSKIGAGSVVLRGRNRWLRSFARRHGRAHATTDGERRISTWREQRRQTAHLKFVDRRQHLTAGREVMTHCCVPGGSFPRGGTRSSTCLPLGATCAPQPWSVIGTSPISQAPSGHAGPAPGF